MAESWFNTGMTKAREVADAGRTEFFGLEDGKTVKIRFLGSEPVNIYEHGVKKAGSFKTFTCLTGTGEECPLCEKKDEGINRRFVGCFAILDRRDGKVKQYKVGIRVLRVLDKFLSKYGTLSDRDYEVTRTGTGTDTQYNFIPEDKTALTDKEKALKLPDFKTILKPKSRATVLAFLKGELGSDKERAVESTPEDDGPPADAEVVGTDAEGVRF